MLNTSGIHSWRHTSGPGTLRIRGCCLNNCDLFMIAILLLLTLATAYDWTAVDKIIQDAISARTFPGAVLGIATDKEILYTKAYGTQTYKQDMYTPSVNLDSKWDLASLTKVVGTLSAVMHLYDDKKIHIDDLVTKFVP